jgi:hypothetical protein
MDPFTLVDAIRCLSMAEWRTWANGRPRLLQQPVSER